MQDKTVVVERFPYQDMHRRRAFCRIEAITLPDSRVAVIATELPDNPGMSITNAVEYAATEACKYLEIDPRHLVWIEHYSADPCPVCSGTGKHRRLRCLACHGRGTRREKATYDLVKFAHVTSESQPIFHEPHRRVMKDDDWRASGLAPRTSTF